MHAAIPQNLSIRKNFFFESDSNDSKYFDISKGTMNTMSKRTIPHVEKNLKRNAKK